MNRAWRFALPALLVVAVILRLDGITFDLPYVYDIDEQDFVNLAITMLRNHDPNPHWFGHPGTTMLYLMCVLYGALFTAGHLAGQYHNPAAFQAAYLHDATPFYLTARLLIAAFGVLSIALTYCIGRRMFGVAPGLLAAALLTVSPVHVYFSQRIRSDLIMTVFLLVAFWFILNIAQSGSLRDYLLAGVCIGLATDSKYPAILMLVPLLAAHVAGPARTSLLRLVWCGAALLGTSFLASPFLYLDFSQTLHDLRVENRPYEFGGVGGTPLQNLIWYVQEPLRLAFTAAGLLFALAGFVFLLRDRKRAESLLLAVTPVVLLAFLACLHLRWERWTVPVLPFLALLFAYGAMRLIALDAQHRLRLIPVASALCIGGIFAALLFADRAQGRELLGTDTRTEMAQYILHHVPAQSSLLSEIYNSQLPKTAYRYYEVQDSTGTVRAIDPRRLRHEMYEPFGTLAKISDPDFIPKAGIEYILVNESRYAEMQQHPERFSADIAAEARVLATGTALHAVQPRPGVNGGPRLLLLRVRAAPHS